MIQNIDTIFNINHVTEDETIKIMGQFKDSAAGWDSLMPSIIKNIKEYLKLPLAHICNLSFSTGVFPTELKLANVAPVYKGKWWTDIYKLQAHVSLPCGFKINREIDV